MKENYRNHLVARLPRGSVGVEVGVHKGDFSSFLLDSLQPKKLHLIDPWRYESSEQYDQSWYGGMAEGQAELDERFEFVKKRFQEEIVVGAVVVHRMDSASALEAFEAESLDWVYIDGNHLYEFVLKDLNASLDKIKKGGVICGDDYQSGGWWDGGVIKAVDEFCDKFSLRKEIIGNQFLIYL
ncbi:class I SAM-dependent methyltransferase [Nitrincola sp.]|uniref:class I SAM-dependent methyltransferase n=1 Tax=Oceanospirillales TaxID=135619 RepID=UPI003A8DBBAC